MPGPFKSAQWCAAVLLATLASVPASAAPTVATARAKAITIRPLSLLKTVDLSFGNVIAGPVAGTVTVSPVTDAATYTDVTGAGGAITASRFVGAGTANQLVFIRASNAPFVITRQGGGATMTIDQISINAAVFIFGDTAVRFIPDNRTLDIRFGGRLRVGANQPEGTYEGTFAVTVDYQ